MTDSRSLFSSFHSLSLSPFVVSSMCVQVFPSADSRGKTQRWSRTLRKAGRRSVDNRISFYLARREKHGREEIRGKFQGSHTHTYTHTRESVLPGAHATNLELRHDKSCRVPHFLSLFALSATESDPARSCSMTRFVFSSRQSRAIGRLRAREGRASDRLVGGLHRRAVAGGHQLIRVAGIARSAIDEGTGRRYFRAVLFVTKRETNLAVPGENLVEPDGNKSRRSCDRRRRRTRRKSASESRVKIRSNPTNSSSVEDDRVDQREIDVEIPTKTDDVDGSLR